MRLNVHQEKENRHQDTVACLAWTGNNELLSCSDDKKILKWSGDGEFVGEVSTFEPSFITDIHWFPYVVGKGRQQSNDVYVISTSDGKIHICSKGGRVEKSVEAHKGAALCVRWNLEGSALLSVGEDGSAKIWSRTGMLRSQLIQSGSPIYSAAWGPDNDQVLVTSGKNIMIKPLQPSAKSNQWKAHDGNVLKLDWNCVNGLILTGGEDKKYKVWDAFGRNLFSSAPHDYVITSVSWAPTGEMFAVGSYNTVRICDKIGWSYALSKPNSGSIYNIAWTPDSTQFAGSGGNGAVVFGNIMDRRYEWRNFEATLTDDNKVIVKDITNDIKETLEFRDRVLKISLGYGHIIVATASQCYIYTEKNFNTPAIIDMHNAGRVITIIQSENFMLIVDTVIGIQVFSYDGRVVSNPKYGGLRPEFLNPETISLSNDAVAMRDKTDEKSVYMFDAITGRPIGDGPLKHTIEISEVGLDQVGTIQTRQLAFVDKNRDLYLTNVMKPQPRKLGNMVESFMWNDNANILAAVMDGKLTVWYYPNALFVDQDVINVARFEKEGSDFGPNTTFISFCRTDITLRRADGAVVAHCISPYPELLNTLAKKKLWEDAVRICRFAKEKSLWAALAAMAVSGQELNTAEVAYAAIDEVDKVQFICYIKDIPTTEGRQAELALFRRQPKEAEAILLQAGLFFRAIYMNITLYNWERALDLAVKHKTHVDTVIFFREKYLKSFGRKETNKKFLQYSQGVKVEWANIQAKIQMEEEREQSRTGGSKQSLAA